MRAYGQTASNFGRTTVTVPFCDMPSQWKAVRADVEAFETELAADTGTGQCVAVSNGSAGATPVLVYIAENSVAQQLRDHGQVREFALAPQSD
ncbi:MAG: hypothetical protein AB7S38_26295 [Vulcanimicrobiota bacterium]